MEHCALTGNILKIDLTSQKAELVSTGSYADFSGGAPLAGTQVDKYGNTQFIKIEPKLRKNDGFMAYVVAEFSADLLKETVVYV